MTLMLVASVLAACSVLLLVVSVPTWLGREDIQDRLGLYLAEHMQEITLQELELSQPFSERVLLPLVRRTARFFAWMLPQNRTSALRARLLLAGGAGSLGAADFVGVKGLCMVPVIGLALLFGFLVHYPVNYTSMVMLGMLGLGSFFLPDVWLSRRIRLRQQKIIESLPDAMDMLTITIEAGLSFENGLQEIIGKWDDQLSREFARVLRDIGMGQGRRHALNAMAERTGVQDIISFVSALNQAEELGVSIGRVLKVQSDEMRVRRRQRAQERANQAPIKMMFPLVFLIFPAIFAVLLGPAIPQLMQSLGNVGG